MKKSQGTMYRLFLFQVFLTMLIAIPMTSAHAQRHGGGGYGQMQPEILKARLNMSTRGYVEIPVKQKIKQATGVQLQGLKVLKIIMKASSMRGHGTAQLLINGSPVGYAQTLGVYEERIVFEMPRRGQNVIGQGIRSIKIAIQGSVQTKMVAIKVQDTYQGGGQQQGPRVVRVSTYEHVRGTQRISLEQLVGYNRQLENKLVQEITITAQGTGSIMVVAQGSQLGSIQVGRRGQVSRTIRVHGGALAHQIKLRMNGNMTITNVSVKVSRY